MRDQAESLRRMVDGVMEQGRGQGKVIAVVSGKGGVGKSNVSLNFALTLSRQNQKVALIDLDLGMGNLDILMGLSPSYHIIDMIKRELTIWDIAEQGPEGITYIAGGSGLSELVELNERQMERFFQQFESLGAIYDYIILDMGAGATAESLRFILSAHEIFVVTTPEPTSITDAYAMVKYICKEPIENPEILLIVNRAESKREGEQTAANFKRVVSHFLKKDIHSLGYLPQDSHVVKAVKAQAPFVLHAPQAKASMAMGKLVHTYLGHRVDRGAPSYQSFMKKIRKWFR